MPTYEYLCNACGHEFEREQRITDDPVKTCPECRKRKVKRLISRTSFVLKGGGWYSDLYSSQKPGKDKGADAGSDAAPDAKSDSPEKKPKKDKKKGGKESGKKGKGPKAAA
jgi:putative FmdB family regulatory protein